MQFIYTTLMHRCRMLYDINTSMVILLVQYVVLVFYLFNLYFLGNTRFHVLTDNLKLDELLYYISMLLLNLSIFYHIQS